MAVHKPSYEHLTNTSSSVSMANECQKISGAALKRLQKEFKSFVTCPPEGLQLDEDTRSGEDLGLWKVKM